MFYCNNIPFTLSSDLISGCTDFHTPSFDMTTSSMLAMFSDSIFFGSDNGVIAMVRFFRQRAIANIRKRLRIEERLHTFLQILSLTFFEKT